MSTQQVQAAVLGQVVTAEVVDREPTADYGEGPRDQVVIDVDGARYRVDESDIHPR